MTHILKTLPEYFRAVEGGIKNFDIRKDDRDFRTGDLLVLQEFYSDTGRLGKEVAVKVTYVLRNVPNFGLQEGFCIMGIRMLK